MSSAAARAGVVPQASAQPSAVHSVGLTARVPRAVVEDIEGLACDLTSRPTRSALVEALDDLSSTILEHLDREETTLQPVLESWSEWPEDASRHDEADH